MSLVDHITESIFTDPQIVALAVDDAGDPRPVESWFFSSETLGEGENPVRPDHFYIVWNELSDTEHPEVQESSDARTRFFSWYVYDRVGYCDRIDNILHLIKRRVKLLGHFTTADGVVCAESRWLGTSGRIPSDGYDSSTKFGTRSHTVSR